MKNPDHNELWRDALNDGIEDAFAAESLAGMLAYARGRRRRRRVFGVCAAAGALGVLLWLFPRAPTPAPRPSTADRVPNVPAGTPENAGLARVHFLTDEELLSRFPNRPIALIGPPENRRLVFLDDTN